jgi:hypothetical protein
MVGMPMPKIGDWAGTKPTAPTGSFSSNPSGKLSSSIFAGLGAPESNPYIQPEWIAPQYQPAAAQAAQPTAGPATSAFGIGAPDTGNYGGGSAPEPQAKPVMSETDWLAGDGEYQNQMSEYGNTLTDFLARLTRQRNEFTDDYNVASKGLDRNETQGLLGLGEDFTSRGMANSGLFANSRKEAQTGFQNQRDGMKTAKTRAETDFSTQESDKRKSTESAQNNAKSASLGRMSMKQMF